MTSDDGREPRKMIRTRAIQIGLAGPLCRRYLEGILSIDDVTDLSHAVGRAHQLLAETPESNAMVELLPLLPREELYVPEVTKQVMIDIALATDVKACKAARLRHGKANGHAEHSKHKQGTKTINNKNR
jgi:hypothetical protein